MSSDPILLHIVTDNAEKACLGLFGFARSRAPSWVGFINDANEFVLIPEGGAVMSLWFDRDPVFEMKWRVHRAGRVLDLDYGKHAVRIEAWLKRRAEAETALIAQWLDEVPAQTSTADSAAAANAAGSSTAPARLPKVMWS